MHESEYVKGAYLVMQVDTSSAQLAHDQAAIEYCFKPALGYKATGQSAGQAVLDILSTLRELADNAQVGLWEHVTKRRSMKLVCQFVIQFYGARICMNLQCWLVWLSGVPRLHFQGVCSKACGKCLDRQHDLNTCASAAGAAILFDKCTTCLYDPGILPSSASQGIHGIMYLRPNLSRKCTSGTRPVCL